MPAWLSLVYHVNYNGGAVLLACILGPQSNIDFAFGIIIRTETSAAFSLETHWILALLALLFPGSKLRESVSATFEGALF
ncbi:hypothetical protein ARMSODRAFT_80610 [Armillaria solidipes]|uniref:Uncharacterized protein n=1 Tax=Armillaria solidipes TaxID=1076256 RepID=A0A2H3B573_9AGAR|nr:hypothetical protein ARMSODRAFT_80610 [Armillaria solidipes]